MEIGNRWVPGAAARRDPAATILAPWVAQLELTEGSLRALPLGPRKLERFWGIRLRKGQPLGLAQQTFIGLCSAVAENMGFRGE